MEAIYSSETSLDSPDYTVSYLRRQNSLVSWFVQLVSPSVVDEMMKAVAVEGQYIPEVSVRCRLCVSSLVLNECLVHLKEIWTGVNRSSTQRMSNNSATFTSRMFVVKLGRLAQMFGAKQTQNIYILEGWIKLHSCGLTEHWASVWRVVWCSWLTEWYLVALISAYMFNLFVNSATLWRRFREERERGSKHCLHTALCEGGGQLHASTALVPRKALPVSSG
jgi:hypothetical protein